MEDQRQMNVLASITCLPPEILVKILSCLPAKSAVQLRCSCKFFYSNIPEPRFAFRILLLLPSITGPELSLSLYSVSYSEESHVSLLQADSAQQLDAQGLLWPTYGKMCVVRDETGAEALFHLSTGQRIYLPADPARNSSSGGRRGVFFSFACLGIDSISGRHKVFKSAVYTDWRRVWNRQWVLTLEVDNSWREIDSTITGHTDAAVHIHGIIYLIPEITDESSKIVAMDVATEKFISFVPLPSEYQSPRELVRGWVPWMELNGRLAFINFIIIPIPIPAREGYEPAPSQSKIEIWRLERSMEEWKKQTLLAPSSIGGE